MAFASTSQARLNQSPAMALALQDIYTESSTQLLPLGTSVTLCDGRKYVYAKNGAAAMYAGQLAQSEAPSATSTDEVVAVSAAVGDLSISITFGGAKTANLYANGFMYVNDDTGEGHLYTVKRHAAGTTAVIIYLNEPIRDAITAGAGTVSFIKHPLRDLITATAATMTAAVMGVPNIDVTAEYYFWLQVKGPCPVLGANSTFVVGNMVAAGTTAGAVDLIVDACILPIVGTVLSVNAGTEYLLIMLNIHGF